jgi:hypothetical protein
MTKFLLDAAYAFVTIVGSGFIVLVDIITHIMHGVQRLCDSIIMPAVMEGFADANIMLLVFAQMYHECMSKMCACVAHRFLQIAQYSHAKSEKLIHRYWTQ